MHRGIVGWKGFPEDFVVRAVHPPAGQENTEGTAPDGKGLQQILFVTHASVPLKVVPR